MPLLRRIARFFPAAIIYAVITALSSRAEFPIEAPFSWFDKLVHFAEFSLLGLALAFGTFRGRTAPRRERLFREASGLWIFGTGLGLLDEVHQMFVPGRNADLADAASDALGIALGIGLYLVFRRRRPRL